MIALIVDRSVSLVRYEGGLAGLWIAKVMFLSRGLPFSNNVGGVLLELEVSFAELDSPNINTVLQLDSMALAVAIDELFSLCKSLHIVDLLSEI